MKFPIALEAYPNIEQQDDDLANELIERRVAYNQIEVDVFIREHSHNRIVTKPINAQELSDERINDLL